MILKTMIALLFTGIFICFAAYDANRIKSGKRIYHGLNGLVTLLFIFPAYLLTRQWFFVLGLLALKRIVFDTALNLFRGLRFDYISSSTTSIIDKISYRFQVKYGYVSYYGIFLIVVFLSIILK